MRIGQLLGGKASGIVSLVGRGIPVPPTTVVERLPPTFPEVGADRLIVRASEYADSRHDAIAAQSISGSHPSVVASRDDWEACCSEFKQNENEIASYVLQTFIEHRFGIMGHTDASSGESYIALASSPTTLAAGGEATFEAVLLHDSARLYTHSSSIPPEVLDVTPQLARYLNLLEDWPHAGVLEWEAVMAPPRLWFVQCQASTAELPDWSR